MNDSLFIDVWGWLQIFGRRESRHEEVARYYRRFRRNGGTVFTTDYVLDETITQLFLLLPYEQAAQKYQQIARARIEGLLDVTWITPMRFRRAIELRRTYSDKPDISFTDLTSMAVMEELDVRDVLTGDAHFEHVGTGFRRQP